LKRRDKCRRHADAALIELTAAKRHVRQMHEPRVLAHVEISDGVPHFIAVQQNVTV
jgi:hypothetical protein